MQILTLFGVVAVLSNIASAVPQPHAKITHIQEKRWNWPWNHGGAWGWGGDDDDVDDDDDDDADDDADDEEEEDYDDDDALTASQSTSLSASLSASLLRAPQLRSEKTSTGFVSTSTILLPSSTGIYIATDLLNGTSANLGLSNGIALGVSTATDLISSSLSSVIISVSPTSTFTSTSTSPSPISNSKTSSSSSSPMNISSPTVLSALAPLAPLIFDPSTSTSPSPSPILCPANPTSIITVTENCTTTHWITINPSLTLSIPLSQSASTSESASESAPWTTTPLVLPSSDSPIPSPANNSGIWTMTMTMTGTVTPIASSSRGWTTTTSLLSDGSGGLVLTGTERVGTGIVTSSAFVSGSSSEPEGSLSSSSRASNELTATTLLNSTTTLPYSTSSSISSSAPLSPSPPSQSQEPTPIITGTSDLHPSTTIPFTTTVTAIQISGIPNPAAVHCGLHGLPVGDFFLAEFVEDKAGVDVTLRGCWEFCRGIYGIDKGCVAYSFYPEPGTGAPRCDLFGGSVAQSLDSVLPGVPNVWFDLECGDPRGF